VIIGRPSYSWDIFGRRILTGLTFFETCEFERLDAEPPIDEHGHILGWERWVISAQSGTLVRVVQNASSGLRQTPREKK
jgi:hypothetical protein